MALENNNYEDPLSIVNKALERSQLSGHMLEPNDLNITLSKGRALYFQFFYYCSDLILKLPIYEWIHLIIRRLT